MTTELNIHFTEGSTDTLTLTVSEAGKPAAAAELSAAEVEAMIQVLAEYRTRMAPEVPKTLPEDLNPRGPADPVYAVVDVPVVPGKMLMIRHDGIGWLTFLLPQSEADKLAHGLREISSAAKAPVSQSRH